MPNLNLVSAGLFALGCLGIAVLILLAPRRPRFGAVAFLVLAAFLLTNKVYSPQYVLWLLPFVILARPRWRDWLVFTAGELIYFVAIWWHLGGLLARGQLGRPDLLAGGDHPAGSPRAGWWSWSSATSSGPSTTPYAPAGWTTRPAECWTARPTPSGGPASRRTPHRGPSPRRGRPSASDTRDPPSDLSEAQRAIATTQLLTSRSDGRIVVQAWLASRGLIALVALLLAVLEGRRLTEMVSNWDVQHFENWRPDGYLAASRTAS